MDITVTALGAIVALIIAIFLIIKKVHPAYSLILGALVGGIVGGASLTDTVTLMIEGSKGMMPAILRIVTAGVLVGVLIESKAAAKIASTIVDKIGESKALIALAIATMVLTMVGVFVDVAVITVSPIALAIGHRVGLSKTAILLAMIGGGKAGNIMSPNPNAITGPVVTIILLMLRPTLGIAIDPLIALPVGGIVGVIAMGKWRNLNSYATFGIGKMTGVAILLIGTGTLAGIISNSGLKDLIIYGINMLGLPSFALAPVSGVLMSAATASTTSGTAVASSVFGPAILELGVAPLSAAAMIHSGATVLDHLPHGSFFHATGGSVGCEMKERLMLIPFESLVGVVMAVTSTIIFGIIL